MSPALSYTRSTPPLRLPSRSSSQSSYRDSPVLIHNQYSSERVDQEDSEDCKDTVPLLRGIYSSPHQHQPVVHQPPPLQPVKPLDPPKKDSFWV
ncbi:hypothetical protein EB796_022458 [Bugula neritina]|uniref:Uncharacterized protein n=1 Tax=Bugula neritina TaxID=10212 RepID=A0A7J7J0M8_BUGNE|nr:hypothetical protein EB796_022458 [Bugula neritina]